jgi:hypothetical protein
MTSGSQNTIIGTNADVSTATLTNATALGYGAVVTADNTVQLGSTTVANVKTSGTITAGAITYPNTAGTNGYYLKTDGSGTASWAAVSSGATSVGTIAGSSTAYGASITSGVLNLAPADANNGGIMTIGSQTFSGSKTFNSNILVNGMTVGSSSVDANNNNSYYATVLGINAKAGSYATSIGNNASAGSSYGVAIGRYASAGTSYSIAIGGLNATASQSYSVAIGGNAPSATGVYSTAIGGSVPTASATFATALGSSTTASGQNSTALGYGASVTSPNTIQLGNSSVTNVNTSGTITAGDVTYPNTTGTNGQVLTTNGSGTLTWSTPTFSADEMKLNRGGNKPCDIVNVTTSLTVYNSLVTSNSIIILTTQNGVAGSSGKYPAVVHNKQNGSFEIHHNWGGSLQVAYLIINPN